MATRPLEPAVILVADRTLSGRYTILFEGIFATMQTTQVPEVAMKRLVSPPLRLDSQGRAHSAALGIRRIEAALIAQGVTAEDEVVCTTPEGLDRLLGPWVKVVGVSSSDPLGRAMSNTTTKHFLDGDLYTGVWTDRMMTRLARAKEMFDFKIVAGGAGAWQWALDRPMAERHGLDAIFDGYGEEAGVRLIADLLKVGRADTAPECVSSQQTAEDSIAPIRGASLLGIVELSRGCGRGCAFCTMARRKMVHLPVDTILSDIETNVKAGIRSVVSGSEDLFRYGASGGRVDFNTLHDLLVRMKEIDGLSFMQIDHANVTSVLQLDDAQLAAISRLLRWGAKSDYLWVNMGVESANGHLVAANSAGKIAPFDPADWGDMVRDAVERLNRTGFFPVLSIILGLPGETPRDVEKTFELVKEISEKRAVVFPIFHEPVWPAAIAAGESFTMDRMRPDHLALFRLCYEINFKWVPRLFWDNQRAGGVPFFKRALMRLLGKSEIRTWRRKFSHYEQVLRDEPRICTTPPEEAPCRGQGPEHARTT